MVLESSLVSMENFQNCVKKKGSIFNGLHILSMNKMQLLRDTIVFLKRKSDPTSILVAVLTSSGLKQLNSLICVTNLLSMVMQRSHQWNCGMMA